MITKIVTSLSPHRVKRQRECIESWRAHGLPIVAVQTTGEIESISKLFDGVEFVPAEPEQNAWNRPHLPRLTELLKQAESGTILLINSDIIIADSPERFRAEWMRDDADTLVAGVRHDHKPGGAKVLNPYGIDAFRITPEMAAGLKDIGFAIGVPGWDYWLPWELWKQGCKIRAAESTLLHELHDMGYPDEAIKTAYGILLENYRMPQTVFTIFIQWVTGREGMKRFQTKPKVRSLLR